MKKRNLVILFGSMLLLVVIVVPTFAAAPDNVHGLVFLDDDRDGVWDPGEAGYGGELTWVEELGIERYIGATITLISPNYDEYTLESAAYRELDEGEVDLCSYQDSVVDGEINENPIRPCSGTWGLPGVSSDVRWEVWVTPPGGYEITYENPQYFTSGSGQLPIDLGIAPIS
jgi:hypothetical protein